MPMFTTLRAPCGVIIFFYSRLRPGRDLWRGATVPSEKVAHEFSIHFGSMQRFKHKVIQMAEALVLTGPGWLWLVDNDGHWQLLPLYNNHTPLGIGHIVPILCVDLWEHAYAFDYGTDVSAYVSQWFRIIDWDLVEDHLATDRKIHAKYYDPFKENPLKDHLDSEPIDEEGDIYRTK